MTKSELIHQIKTKQTFLCIGLDADLEKIPQFLLDTDDPIFEFNKQIIDATRQYCVAYKPNTAFFEAYGVGGWRSLQKTINYIGKEHFIIADAKRGDIGNTSERYAKAFFDQMHCDAVTVAPYMGSDSVKPFLNFEGKWAIILGLTSNIGAEDFEMQDIGTKKLFELVIEISKHWGTSENTMYVIGATRPEMLKKVRKIVPDHFLLIPGIGAQGGSLEQVCKFGLNKDIGILINTSRSVIYASGNTDFAMKSAEIAKRIAEEMKQYF